VGALDPSQTTRVMDGVALDRAVDRTDHIIVVLLSTESLSAISVTSSQLWLEAVKWKIPEMKFLWVLNCALF
jgi:hypothetical protein